MSEKLRLQWNDFKDNANALFENLREDQDFTDVTLASEDGKQVEAHKVILAASSPFFKTILAKHKHPHPLIFMRGVKSDNLMAIVDFLYRGEANVLQDDLDSFLLLAEDLKLKGLMGSSEEARDEVKRESYINPMKLIYKTVSNTHVQSEKDPPNKLDFGKDERTIATLNNSDEYMQKLDEKVKSMIEKSERRMPVGKIFHRVCLCKVCGKEGQWVSIRDHIEINHLEGVSLACSQCEKTSRSRHGLRQHKKLNHKAVPTEYFSI